MSFAVFTDTSANLPTPMIKEKNIHIVPFLYYYDGKESACLDTEQFDGHAFYDMIREGVKVNTTQINPHKYVEYMRPVVESGEDIIFVGMSSGISGSFNSLRLAAAELMEKFPDRKVCLVDALTASLGEGIPVLKAVELRDAGVEVEEAERQLNDFCKKMCSVFMVDDLMHLKRTGRLSGAVAFIGTVLQLKPLMKGDETGHIVNIGKARGRRRAIETLAEKYDALAVEPENQLVGIAHADCEEEANYLAELLNKNHPPKELLMVCYEPVTGSHVGPGTIALFFEGDEDVRRK
ncbi:MAG: DegV family protein [Clostridia bacterium]|nr:DegV family protein [Clostridia bacterium]